MFRTIYCGIIMLVLLLATTACDNSPAESELPTAIATFTAAPTSAAVATVATTAATMVDTPVATTAVTMTNSVTATAITVSTPTAQAAMAAPLTPIMAATVTVTASVTVTLAPTAGPTQSPTLAPTSIPAATPTAALVETPTSASPPATNAVATDGNLPPAIAALLPNADAAAGQQLTVMKGCTVCHSLEKDVRMVGPSWYSVGANAGVRVSGQSAEFYLYNSILHPNDFVVPDYLPNLMPGNFGELLTEQELANTISYLLTLQGE